MDECLTAGKAVSAGQRLAFEPALVPMFAQHLHHAAIGRAVIVPRQSFGDPGAAGDVESVLPAVGGVLVRTEPPEVPCLGVRCQDIQCQDIQCQDIAQETGTDPHRTSRRSRLVEAKTSARAEGIARHRVWTAMGADKRTLVLMRHGQSEDNERDLFSGWRDPALTARGIAEAQAAGRAMRAAGLRFDCAFTSGLRRAQATLALLLEELGQPDLPVEADIALNERDYGALAGLNKTEARARFGVEQVRSWRKSYEAVPPGGESLAMTAARVWPFFEGTIAPRLRDGARVLVVAHGNALRALLVRLDGIAPEAIEEVNIGTAEFLVYGGLDPVAPLALRRLPASSPSGDRPG